VNSRIFLPKLGWVRYRNSRKVFGKVKNVTVSMKCGKCFIAVQTEREIDEPVSTSTRKAGVDVGVECFAVLSDGTIIDPADALKEHLNRLAQLQRRLARKKKFSQNWKKAKTKLTKLHSKIANCRKDFLHKTSTMIGKNHARIYVEDLKVKDMSKSAAGTIEQPGRNVKQKSGLNRAILDQAWGEFRRQLAYKLEWSGGDLVAVPPQNTSRSCPACGHVSAENRATRSQFLCVHCGFQGHADAVAAINILNCGLQLDSRAGHAQLVCQVNGAVTPSATETHRNAQAAIA
jgi:putative transposase